MRNALGLPDDKVMVNIDRYGNHRRDDSAGLRDAVDQGKLKRAIWCC